MYIDQRHSTSSSSVCRKLFSVCEIVHDTNVIFFLALVVSTLGAIGQQAAYL